MRLHQAFGEIEGKFVQGEEDVGGVAWWQCGVVKEGRRGIKDKEKGKEG